MREKEQKRGLEEQIMKLTSQMISTERPTGEDVGDGDVRRSITVKSQGRTNTASEIDDRLADLERERECIEHDKAQVERYKQLLLKQRDIMIALTQRLNERDEQIMALQDELDAYDKNQAALENKLDEKTALCIHLQRVSLEGVSQDLRSTDTTSVTMELRRELDAVRLEENALERRREKPLHESGTSKVNKHTAGGDMSQRQGDNNSTRVCELSNLLEFRDKERKAVQTIFEKKIAVLIDSIATTIDVTPNSAPKAAALKDLNALMQLAARQLMGCLLSSLLCPIIGDLYVPQWTL